MKIYYLPLNDGEVYPCRMRIVKERFRDTGVRLSFERGFGTFAYTPDAYYVKRNISGPVVANMYTHARIESPLLSLYELKKYYWTERLTEEFESIFLPKYLEFYQTHLYDLKENNHICHVYLVEYAGGELKEHRFSFR